MDENTNFGFTFGPAQVTRICSDKKHGVWILISGNREEVEVRVTNSGLIRVFGTRKARNVAAFVGKDGNGAA